VKTIEETDEFVVQDHGVGGLPSKQWKTHGGVPEFLDFTIKDGDSWRKAKGEDGLHPATGSSSRTCRTGMRSAAKAGTGFSAGLLVRFRP